MSFLYLICQIFVSVIFKLLLFIAVYFSTAKVFFSWPSKTNHEQDNKGNLQIHTKGTMSLDLSSLVSVLEQASGSERGVTQKLAEEKLKEWEIQPGYHFLLQSVYTDLSVNLQVRWLAVISFKNGIEKYWRSSRSNAISTKEKKQIREKLFDLIDEPNKQLSIQNSQAISRICRFDFPSEWPELFDLVERIMLQSVKEENNVKIHNLLLILNQIIKNLSMAKIGRTRPALQNKLPIVIPLLIKIYTKFFNEWLETLDFGVIEIGYLALKVLKRAVVDVYDNPHHSNDIIDFLTLSVKHFQLLLQHYDQHAPSEILEKYIKRYAKIYESLTKSNPTNLILLPCSKEILYTLLKVIQEKASLIYNNDNEDDADSLWEFLSIKTLLIFKSLINFLFKKGSVLTLKAKSDKNQIESAIHFLTTAFFTEELILSLTDLMINYYIKLRPVDLEAWVNESEEWANDEVNQNYEYQIRPCSENFFQGLINNFKDLLVPYVLNKVQNELINYQENSVQNVLIKDSIFTIFQLSSNSIHEIIDFNNLLTTVFIPEAIKNDLIENKLIKRRVCLLVTEWIGLNVISAENLQNIYRMLLSFLEDSEINDKVVRLSAIQALRSILKDWEFKKEDFKQFIKDFTEKLLELVTKMQLTESKLFILDTISDLIQRTNPLISINELDQLLLIVPKFWDLSNNSNEMILKNSLLRILKNLIISLNENSESTWSIVLPLIKICCSPQSEYYSLLSEDGFELWLAVLQFYPSNQSLDFNSSLIQDLNDLYGDALLNQTEILPLVLEIFRSYSLLIPNLSTNDSTRDFILNVFKVLSRYIIQLRDDSLDILISTLEITILQSYSKPDDHSKLLSLLMESQLLPNIISMVLDDEQSPVTIAKLLLIISRLSYSQPSNIVQVFHYIYQDENEYKTMFHKFITVWFAKMENNIGSPRNRKIHILGLSSLLKTGEEAIFKDFKILITLWISQLEEVNETNGDIQSYHSNYLFEFSYNEDLSIQENGEYFRFQNLVKTNDPVHNLNMKEHIKEVLNSVKQNIGEDNFNNLFNSVDQTTVENFNYFLYHINQ